MNRPEVGSKLAYKQHFTVDACRPVITAVEVTPGAAEDSRLVSALLELQPMQSQAFCVDSHYGVPEVHRELERRGSRATIPEKLPQDTKTEKGRFCDIRFQYIPDRDVYQCAQGKTLRRSSMKRVGPATIEAIDPALSYIRRRNWPAESSSANKLIRWVIANLVFVKRWSLF